MSCTCPETNWMDGKGHDLGCPLARKPVELKSRTFQETAEHFKSVTRSVDWPTDEPDVD
jgi:hypothetical protein